jgi:hypothetical protein
MSDATLTNVCMGLLAVIFVGTAYGLVADEPARKVVTVTLPQAELERQLRQARIDAAREALNAKECNWRDLMDPQRQPVRRGTI